MKDKIMRLLALIFALAIVSFSAQAEIVKSPSIAMHGAPKYAKDFTHLDYVNPDAPKGGTLRIAATGTFNSLNPFILKGDPAAGMSFLGQSHVYDSLMEQSYDEPFSMYGLLAETIEYDTSDKSWVAFNLNPAAKWADGKPVTADDVVWSFNTFIEKGTPFFKAYYGDVTKVEATTPARVKFTFKDDKNAELPLVLSQLAILPKHFWDGKDFGSGSLDHPMGSGPYAVKSLNAGSSITYERRADYWAKDLPINKGKFNFDRIKYDYYKDDNIALEGFFSDEYDFRIENTAKSWATAYDAPPVQDGRITKEEIKHKRPQGMQAFIFNIRKPIFQDKNVRLALNYAFDFEWSNKKFAFGTYKRTDSFFENSDLSSAEGAPSGRVLEILEEYRGKIPDDVFTTRYAPPKTDGRGNPRRNLRKAMKLLDEAGYKIAEDGIRVHDKTGERLSFEIIDPNPVFKRWVLPFVGNLKKIGVETNFRVLDPAQYQNRMDSFDFDMAIKTFGQSSSPGNEQRDFWASEKADIKGSRNYIGIKDPVIDDIIEKLITASNREELVSYTRALDRVLLSGHYLIPQWHIDYWRIAYWNKLDHPKTLSDLTPAIADTWWVKE